MSNTQFGRKATLIVSTGTVGLDLSQMRFKFQTTNSDMQTPNTLYVRVYNLSPETIAKIGTNPSTEFSTITLQAGYTDGNFGIVFQGTIKQTATGRERNVDSFLDIWAADGDLWINNAVVNLSLAAGQTPAQVIGAITGAASSNGTPPVKFAADATGLINDGGLGTSNALSRGKVLFGMSRDYSRDWAKKYGFRWSLQGNEFVVVPITGYRPGEAVVLSSTTGLIGVPEVTQDGVRVRALLNPLIRIGCLVQIAQSDINHITTLQQGITFTGPVGAVVTTAAGYYRVMQAEFEGDTRGQPWWVDMVCLAVDVSAANQNSSVQEAG